MELIVPQEWHVRQILNVMRVLLVRIVLLGPLFLLFVPRVLIQVQLDWTMRQTASLLLLVSIP
jgi:hypothetical protein